MQSNNSNNPSNPSNPYLYKEFTRDVVSTSVTLITLDDPSNSDKLVHLSREANGSANNGGRGGKKTNDESL